MSFTLVEFLILSEFYISPRPPDDGRHGAGCECCSRLSLLWPEEDEEHAHDRNTSGCTLQSSIGHINLAHLDNSLTPEISEVLIV